MTRRHAIREALIAVALLISGTAAYLWVTL